MCFTLPDSKRMVWIPIPYKLFCKDKLSEHERSQFHIDAVQVEATFIAAAAKCTGVVRAIMEEQVSLQCQAARGALKCIYWLVI